MLISICFVISYFYITERNIMNNKNYIFFALLALSGSSFAQNNIPQLVSADKYQPLVNAQNQVSNVVQQPITTQKPVTLFGPTPMPKPVAVFGPTPTQKPIPTPKPVPVNETQTPTPMPKPVAVFGGSPTQQPIPMPKPVAVFGGSSIQKPIIPTTSTIYPKPVFGGTTK